MNLRDALEDAYKVFSPWAPLYAADYRRFLSVLKLLERELGSLTGKKIVDLGSGIGIMVRALNQLGAEAVGLDKFIFNTERENIYSINDFKTLENIWKRYAIRILNSDVVKERLPFPDKTFDLVISDETIEHLAYSPQHMFQEARRVLKPRGYFLITTPNFATLWHRIRFLFLGRSPNWDLKDYFENGENFRGHRREFTVKEVRDILKWSGFAIVYAGTKNVFLNPKRLLSLSVTKIAAQANELLSMPFKNMRDTIYILARALEK